MSKQINNIDSDLLAIKSLFEAGLVQKMRLLEEQAPTKMAKLLGLNYNSYHDKLINPEKFTIRHILLIAKLCNLDANIIFEVVKNEVKNKI